jgi:hypothetical protein
MQKQKMSLANMQGKLSREEMKNIMAGLQQSTGTCQALIADGTGGRTHIEVGLTSAQAQSNINMIHWCCSSCSTASWTA